MAATFRPVITVQNPSVKSERELVGYSALPPLKTLYFALSNFSIGTIFPGYSVEEIVFDNCSRILGVKQG